MFSGLDLTRVRVTGLAARALNETSTRWEDSMTESELMVTALITHLSERASDPHRLLREQRLQSCLRTLDSWVVRPAPVCFQRRHPPATRTKHTQPSRAAQRRQKLTSRTL
jgi:hypothetical protein